MIPVRKQKLLIRFRVKQQQLLHNKEIFEIQQENVSENGADLIRVNDV